MWGNGSWNPLYTTWPVTNSKQSTSWWVQSNIKLRHSSTGFNTQLWWLSFALNLKKYLTEITTSHRPGTGIRLVFPLTMHLCVKYVFVTFQTRSSNISSLLAFQPYKTFVHLYELISVSRVHMKTALLNHPVKYKTFGLIYPNYYLHSQFSFLLNSNVSLLLNIIQEIAFFYVSLN